MTMLDGRITMRVAHREMHINTVGYSPAKADARVPPALPKRLSIFWIRYTLSLRKR